MAFAVQFVDDNIFAHHNSLFSLHWIQKDINCLKNHVTNRFKIIQDSHVKILYVPGKQNLSDICSKFQPAKTTSITPSR